MSLLLSTASQEGESREGGADLLSLGSCDRMHGKGSQLHQERFRLNTRKHFFTERMVKHWNRLHREVVIAPRLSVLKRHLDNALKNMLATFGPPRIGQTIGLDHPCRSLPTELFYSVLFCSILFWYLNYLSQVFDQAVGSIFHTTVFLLLNEREQW